MTLEPYGFATAYAAAIVLLTLALLRRLRAVRKGPRRAAEAEMGAICPGYLAIPLATVLASEAVVRLAAGSVPAIAGRLVAHHELREAWFLVWTVALWAALTEWVVRRLFEIARRPFPVPDLIAAIGRGFALLFFAFWVLRERLGVNIAPLLASTALVTAVVGFALQGVLGNLMSGMSLHLVRSFGIGDWISAGGWEGQVIVTNWRETRIRTTDGQLVVLPNGVIASGGIVNYSRPNALRRHEVFVDAAPEHPPGEVVAALVAAARAEGRVLATPEPTAHVKAYKDWGVCYRLFFWSAEYQHRRPIEGAVQNRIWYEFQRRGVRIPLPLSEIGAVAAAAFRPPEGGTPADLERMSGMLVHSEFGRMMARAGGTSEAEGPLLSDAFLRSLRRLRYMRGEVVFRQGEAGDSCYVILSGRAAGRIDHRGVSASQEFELPTGALFGEMSLMTGLPRTATILAASELELAEIPREALAEALRSRPGLPEGLAEMISLREAGNAEALARLAAADAGKVADSLKKESLMRRFLRLIGRGA